MYGVTNRILGVKPLVSKTPGVLALGLKPVKFLKHLDTNSAQALQCWGHNLFEAMGMLKHVQSLGRRHEAYQQVLVNVHFTRLDYFPPARLDNSAGGLSKLAKLPNSN